MVVRVNENENGLCGEGGMRMTEHRMMTEDGNEKRRTRNLAALISSRDSRLLGL